MSNALTKPQLAILQQAWADGLNGRDKLYQQIKRDHPEAKITWRQVAAFLKRTQPHQLFLYQRKPKPISVFRRSRPLQMLTVDLTALPVQTLPDKTQRKWILLAIDTFSRYAWASVLEPQPPSSGPTAKLGWEAFWPILKEVKEELNGDVTGLVIQSDGGNEFKDRFHDELTRRKIKHYYGVPGKPASQSMVERLNQTIKGKLKRLWRARGVLAQKPWGESTIQAVVASYNDQVHSALPKGVTPADVMDAIDEDATGLIEKVKQHQGKVWARKKGNYEQKWIDEGNQSKYKEGDIVRKISAQPDKYDTQWSVTLYEIAKVTKPRNPVKPVTYRLKKRGAASFIDGTFTSLELQRVPLNDQRQAQESGIPADMLNLDDEANREYVPLRIYEERMKKGGRELLVRWRGFSMREASWVPEQQVAGSVALRKWDKDRATPAEVKVAASLAALL